MEMVVGAANWLLGKVLDKLTDELVAAYLASSELGPNSEQITADLMYTHALLHTAQGRDDNNNPALKWLLEKLTAKADEAVNALDELHYFMIQDKLDGTRHAELDLGGGLQEKARHGCYAVRRTTGNWLPCFSSSPTQDVGCSSAAVAVADHTRSDKSEPDSGNATGRVDRLEFDRVAMSKKIKLLIESIHSKCVPISDLLKIPSRSSTTGCAAVTLERPVMGSIIVQNKLYGRSTIFEKTIEDITGTTYCSETLYVLPIVGPGGIGKTTFTRHLYNDKRIEDHFAVRVWVCVSTDFDVLKLTQEIHMCIPATDQKEEGSIANGTNNLDLLQKSIANRLKSKKFLLVLDDIWKCDSDAHWTTLLSPFTKGEAKGSMVLVTTRFPKIEERVMKATIPINLQGLEPGEFWEFFQACVFGEKRHHQQYSGLTDIGKEIVEKLKCSPLAATTVARLLKKHFSREHWRKVLENNEWQKQTNKDDIMPGLKISYDYLPFHLKKCFSYFSLYPEDYRFQLLEMTRFWTAIGIIDSTCQGENYLEELVENGFLMKQYGLFGGQWYVMHDLLRDLSLSVSSQECANISSVLNFRANNIAQSVHHLSITMEDVCDETFKKQMTKLKKRINIGNLRTLMIFREYREQIVMILNETFAEIEGLRVLFIVMNSPESLPKNFSKLLHLRYLRIGSTYDSGSEMSLPNTLPRFYHLIFLDLESWHGSCSVPKDINRLVNLRHIIANDELQSNVPGVGNIEHLEDLRVFHVKKESVGFELEELGTLTNLSGSLGVYNLEKVATKEEGEKANLDSKENLQRLELVWGIGETTIDADAADGLEPHGNLRELVIIDHGGSIGPPNWLLHIKYLESLTLEGVSWGTTLPPFGQITYLKILRLKDIAGAHFIGPDHSFMHLKEVVFENIPDLEEWLVEPSFHLFPMLESISCSNCPNFVAMPFLSECFVPCTQDIHPRYPSLRTFFISGCQLSLPPMPHISTLAWAKVDDDHGYMTYSDNSLASYRYRGAIAFHNIGKLESITFGAGSEIPWTDVQKLTSLRELLIEGDSSMQSLSRLSSLTSLTSLELKDCYPLTMDGFNPLITAVNLKELAIYNRDHRRCSVAKDLLSDLVMVVSRAQKLLPATGSFFHLTKLDVDIISAVLVTPICSLLTPTLRKLNFSYDGTREESFTEEEENALQLLTSLQQLEFYECTVPSLPQGLYILSSLSKLSVIGCYGIRLLPSLPTSLQELWVVDCCSELRNEAVRFTEANPGLRTRGF